MREEIDVVLEAANGVASRSRLKIVGRHTLDNEIKARHLVRVRPRVYARPWDTELLDARELAAVVSAGPDCALSHTTGLRRWGLPSPGGPIHLTTPPSRRIRSDHDLTVHRTTLPIEAIVVRGAPSVVPAAAIVASWPLLTGAAQRAPAILATRTRLLTVDALRVELDKHTRLRGRGELCVLLELIESGCQSELELWGYSKVFDSPGLRGAIRQRTVIVRGKVYRLDMAYETEQVAVELDGRAYHAAPAQWERDIARDLALATLGWQTIRLSHRRLTMDIAGCRRDVLDVLAQRRRRTSGG